MAAQSANRRMSRSAFKPSANLAFIRATMAWDTEAYYEEKIDVWLFADRQGFKYLIEKIRSAAKAKRNIHLLPQDLHPTSMRVVIVPAIGTVTKSPRLRFVERFVAGKQGPNMELIILGNNSGYRQLANELSGFAKRAVGDPSDHIHFDDLSDSHVVRRSVSLNVRGPVRRWTRKSFGPYENLVFKKRDDFVPAGLLTYRQPDEEYVEIDAKGCELLTLER